MDTKLSPGNEIDFEIRDNTAFLIPIKTIKIPMDQAWYWTSEWQEKKRKLTRIFLLEIIKILIS